MGWSMDEGRRAARRVSLTRWASMPRSSADLRVRGLPPELLGQALLGGVELGQGLADVDGEADGAPLVGDGAGDGLADPPGGVGGELEPPAPVELLHRPHQAQVALLDQVDQGEAPPGVALGDADHQAQVGQGELLQRRGVPGLDPLRQLHLLLGRQQRDVVDVLQVLPHGVRVEGLPLRLHAVELAIQLDVLLRLLQLGLVLDHLDPGVHEGAAHGVEHGGLRGLSVLVEELLEVLFADVPPQLALFEQLLQAGDGRMLDGQALPGLPGQGPCGPWGALAAPACRPFRRGAGRTGRCAGSYGHHSHSLARLRSCLPQAMSRRGVPRPGSVAQTGSHHFLPKRENRQ